MKKKLIIILFAIASLFTLSFGLVACNTNESEDNGGTHTHTYANNWSYDETYHWHAATCEHSEAVSGKNTHSFISGVCSVCGYEQQEPHIHYTVLTGAKAATCTEKGNINYWYCSGCGKYYSDKDGTTEINGSVEIPALGHDLIRHEAQTPTCNTFGWEEYYTCSRCDYTTFEKILLDHTASDWITDEEATCTENGSKYKACTVCHTVLETEIIEKLGHDLVYHEYNAPTCTEIGWLAYNTCSRCEYTTYTEISARGHTASDWITDEEATCTENGSKYKACTICLTVLETEGILALGHNYENGVCTRCNEADPDYIAYSQGLEYTLNDDNASYTVSGIGTCTDTVVVIPDTYNSLPITAIGDNAFANCYYLTSVEIPDSVTSISEKSFLYCKNLTGVYVGEDNPSYQSIDGNLFSKDGKTLVIYAAKETAQAYTVPDYVESIGDYAFYECDSLTGVVIGNSVTSIGYSAFYGCSSLTGVVVGNSVTSIGESAFKYCDSLINIEIPDSVESIGKYAFYWCRSLTSVTIGNSVKSIEEFTFFDCRKLKSVIVGNSVTSIGKSAFESCTNLTGVVIPDSVISIGTNAFLECSGLTSVTIGSSVESIGEYAFRWCGKLIEVKNLSALNMELGMVDHGLVAYYAKRVYSEGESYLSTVENAYIIYDDGIDNILVSYIGTGTDLALPNEITQIYPCAFIDCDSLINITIPDSVTSIGNSAFCGCSGLTTVNWNAMECISAGSSHYSVFSSCLNLTTVIIGDNVKIIPSYAFAYCKRLSNITIPDSVESIGESAFYECNRLISITIGNGLSSIGDWAFYNTAYYNDVNNWENDVLYIGKHLIEAKSSISLTYAIKDGTLTIAQYAFFSGGNSSLTSIIIPDSVTNIGKGAFIDCNKLIEVKNLSSLIISPGSEDNGYVGYYAKRVYNEGESYLSTDENGYLIYNDGTDKILVAYTGTETDLVLPSDITQIYIYAFSSCYSMTSIIIPDSVISIGSCAFNNCSHLTSVTIGNSVTSIGNYAFRYCGSLTSVTIPDSVTSIGDHAFYECGSLTSVYYTGNAEQWGNISMGSYSIYLTNATNYYYSGSEPTEEGNFWHYVDGEIVVWVKETSTE